MATAMQSTDVHAITAPVRDDSALGPTEDLDREPDGVPHDVVGLTALFSVLLAVCCGVIFATGGIAGHVGAPLIAAIALPVIVSRLSDRAERERDTIHPSR